MTPVFSSAPLYAILNAGAASGTEVCGILRAEGHRITRADPATNVAGDSSRHFEIDPAVLLAAYRDARRPGAPAVAGWYHSHPGGSPDPSPTDAAQAAPDGRLWLIVGGRTAKLWRAVERGALHDRFDPVRFQVAGITHVEKTWISVQMNPIGQTLSGQ